jgi:hypothetical protein
MDQDTSTPGGGTTDDDGHYVARAQALMARRAELFMTAQAISLDNTTEAFVPAKAERPQRLRRTAGRQLSLPIAREQGRRRARMLR